MIALEEKCGYLTLFPKKSEKIYIGKINAVSLEDRVPKHAARARHNSENSENFNNLKCLKTAQTTNLTPILTAYTVRTVRARETVGVGAPRFCEGGAVWFLRAR